MTIAETGKQIDELIQEHHVYGAETVINGLVRASLKEHYLDEESIIRMIHNAFKREESRS